MDRFNAPCAPPVEAPRGDGREVHRRRGDGRLRRATVAEDDACAVRAGRRRHAGRRSPPWQRTPDWRRCAWASTPARWSSPGRADVVGDAVNVAPRLETRPAPAACSSARRRGGCARTWRAFERGAADAKGRPNRSPAYQLVALRPSTSVDARPRSSAAGPSWPALLALFDRWSDERHRARLATVDRLAGPRQEPAGGGVRDRACERGDGAGGACDSATTAAATFAPVAERCARRSAADAVGDACGITAGDVPRRAPGRRVLAADRPVVLGARRHPLGRAAAARPRRAPRRVAARRAGAGARAARPELPRAATVARRAAAPGRRSSPLDGLDAGGDRARSPPSCSAPRAARRIARPASVVDRRQPAVRARAGAHARRRRRSRRDATASGDSRSTSTPSTSRRRSTRCSRRASSGSAADERAGARAGVGGRPGVLPRRGRRAACPHRRAAELDVAPRDAAAQGAGRARRAPTGSTSRSCASTTC